MVCVKRTSLRRLFCPVQLTSSLRALLRNAVASDVFVAAVEEVQICLQKAAPDPASADVASEYVPSLKPLNTQKSVLLISLDTIN